VDTRTFLQLYRELFTVTGIFSFNIVQYFDAVTHGLMDFTGNEVFACKLDVKKADGETMSRDDLFKKAKDALKTQHNEDWKNYYGVAVSLQTAMGVSQGGTFDGGPGVFADIRWVRNNGAADWGHEIGHAFGLEHSRTDGQFTSNCTGGDPADYTDKWDVMSFACSAHVADTRYGQSGPGMNAWNMRKMQGLDESRVWKATGAAAFSETVVLRPLHWRNLSGYLAAEVPGVEGDSNYLVEFRTPDVWDLGIGHAVILVHRSDGIRSFLMKGIAGQKSLLAGDVFQKGSGPVMIVTCLRWILLTKPQRCAYVFQ